MSWKDNFPKENRYWENEHGILYCGDCLEIMENFSSKSIDLVLTDPPYGINSDRGVGGGELAGRRYNDRWDIRPTKEYFDLLLNCGRNVIIFGGNFFTDLLPVGTHWIVWDKSGEIKFNNPYSGAELLWTNFNKNIIKKYIVIQAGFIAEEKVRFHPTQKPVKLLVMILDDYSIENDIVLDPFLGSGTTAVACERLNRRWIGIEINEKYCQIAVERLRQQTLRL